MGHSLTAALDVLARSGKPLLCAAQPLGGGA
jgi:hypothetical protein